MASCAPEKIAYHMMPNTKQVANLKKHAFRFVNPKTGLLKSAIRGNKLFHLPGSDNSLSPFGMILHDNIESRAFKKVTFLHYSTNVKKVDKLHFMSPIS